jgi:peroxiredoxin
VLLRSLYEERPLALVFLRHFGCTFCREHVNDLRGESELNLAFVSMADRVESEAFQRKMQVTHPFICDPEARLYALFGLKRASMGEVFNPRVFMRGVQAVGNCPARSSSIRRVKWCMPIAAATRRTT